MQSILDEIVDGIGENMATPQPFEETAFGQTLLKGPEAHLRLRVMQLEDDRAAADDKQNELVKSFNAAMKAIKREFESVQEQLNTEAMFRLRITAALTKTGVIPEGAEHDPKAVTAAFMELVKSLNENWDLTRNAYSFARRAYERAQEAEKKPTE